MRLSIIGAGGFVGTTLTRIALQDPRVTHLTLVDTAAFEAPQDARITALTGDFGAPDLRAALCEGADAVVHLAAILGGAADRNYALARAVNVDATLALFEHLRDTAPQTRMVFASTVGVYGPALPDPVTDDTPFDPVMVYGAQKLMMEVALSNFAARGWLDGVSLRPAGIMARRGVSPALKSAFMNEVFHAVAEGRDITLPVAADSCSWMASVSKVAEGFLHAACLPRLEGRRAFNLPALQLRFGDLVAALQRRFPDSASKVRYAPDPEAVALFGSHPRLHADRARALGFPADRDVDALVSDALVGRGL